MSTTINLTFFFLSLHSNFAYIPSLHLNNNRFRHNNNVNQYQMISMGNIRSNIEHMSRLLDENKVSMSWILAKKKQIYTGKYTNGSTGEHKRLNERFNNLTKKEEELHVELQQLIVTALERQLKKIR